MSDIGNSEMIALVSSILRPVRVKDRLFADVGAAVLSETGDVFTGVAVDTAGWGLCAERSALAAMITAGQYRIAKVVAAWKDQNTGKLHVLPPCGICREFMRSIDEGNLVALVIVGRYQSVPLRDLLLFTSGRLQNAEMRSEWPDHAPEQNVQLWEDDTCSGNTHEAARLLLLLLV